MQNIKLGVIGSVGVPAKYGGFETLVHFLVKNLNSRLDMTVYCSKKAYSEEERIPEWNGAKLKYIPLEANGLQSIPYDLWSIIHALFFCDVLLILGVSGCLFLPIIKLFSKKKIIVNIDGLEWRRPKWNFFAKKFLLLSESIACNYADEIITDNRMIKEYVKIRYSQEGNLIEYGADHVEQVAATFTDRVDYPFLNEKYAFKVARIEPENNIHMICEAFSKTPDQEFVLVGNWNNSNYGREVRAAYSKFSNLHLLDPIYDQKVLNLLRSNCHFYVHGHSAGGTNPSLVEAMYLKLPVISVDVIYNRVTTNNQAIFFETAEELTQIIKNIEKYPLRSVARELKKYADKAYTWSFISGKYADLIEGKQSAKALPVIKINSAVQSLIEQAKENDSEGAFPIKENFMRA